MSSGERAGGKDLFEFDAPESAFASKWICHRAPVSITSVMPIYEFHCEACGEDNEVLVRSSRWKGTKCPSCGSTKLEKKFSTFASGSAESDGDACCAAPSGRRMGGCGGCCGGGPHRH